MRRRLRLPAWQWRYRPPLRERGLPELRLAGSYFVVMGANIIGMLVLYLLFRRFKWL